MFSDAKFPFKWQTSHGISRFLPTLTIESPLQVPEVPPPTTTTTTTITIPYMSLVTVLKVYKLEKLRPQLNI